MPLRKVQVLRYGENPHQAAALLRGCFHLPAPARDIHRPAAPGEASLFQQPGGPGCRLGRRDRLLRSGRGHRQARKPRGLACASTPAEAFRRALDTDPKSAFGGAVGVNRVVDEDTAREISQGFFEDLIAPGYTDAALEILKPKRDLRVMAVGEDWQARHQEVRGFSGLDFRRILGGFLVQQRDGSGNGTTSRHVVTNREPTLEELTDLLFAWNAVKHVRSNAIVLARKLALVGVGAGQMSRVDSVELAIKKSGEQGQGQRHGLRCLFPFPDGIEAAADAGVTAIIQPGGSVRDGEVIKAANAAQMAMIFTSRRHFRH